MASVLHVPGTISAEALARIADLGLHNDGLTWSCLRWKNTLTRLPDTLVTEGSAMTSFVQALVCVVASWQCVGCDPSYRCTLLSSPPTCWCGNEQSPTSNALYTDEEIMELTKSHVIERESYPALWFRNAQCKDLYLVPSGKSYPRAQVFSALKLDESRIQYRSVVTDMYVHFLEWKVSPSYYINCMSAWNEKANDGLKLTDPKRRVYGIRLLKRTEPATSK